MAVNSWAVVLQHPAAVIAAGVLADFLIGDPVYAWHPIRLLGRCLLACENQLRRLGLDGRFGGFLLFVLLFGVASMLYGGVHAGLGRLHWSLAWLWNVYLGLSMIAFQDLCRHGLRVGRASLTGDVALCRKHISMLVGRDTANMDARACNRAAVESMSENLVDGVLSPLFFYFLFGPYGIIAFKVASTMDSMVGYKNGRYFYFGWFGARLDDVMNYIPARLSWLLIAGNGLLLPGYSCVKAFKVGWKQHHHLPGPNSGWSEASAAGALGIRLVGPIWKNGAIATTLWIGDPGDPEGADHADIVRMLMLNFMVMLEFFMLMTAVCSVSVWRFF